MSRKILLAMLALSFMLSSCGLGSSGTLSLTSEQTTLAVGETVEVQIMLDSGQNEIDSVDSILNFDPQILELVKVTNGSIFEVYPYVVSDNDKGEAKISAASTDNFFKGQDSYATLTFKALAAGETTLAFVYEKGSTLDSDLMSAGSDILGKVHNLKLEVK